MKRLLYLLLTLSGLLVACNSNNSKKSDTSTSRLLPEPDILERLTYQKKSIDTLFNNSNDKLLVLAKLVDKEELIEIKNENFPENVEVTFNILKDSLGQIISATEFPFSESGDWNITLTHYFDKDGKTFAFERQTNFFNSICTAGVAYETQTEFYDNNFQKIHKMYTLVDEHNKALEKDNCQFPYDYDYKVSVDIDSYLRTNSIKNSK